MTSALLAVAFLALANAVRLACQRNSMAAITSGFRRMAAPRQTQRILVQF